MNEFPLFYCIFFIIWTQQDHAGYIIGGWGGIRTHERREPLPVFKTGAFNRSATHPDRAVCSIKTRGLSWVKSYV